MYVFVRVGILSNLPAYLCTHAQMLTQANARMHNLTRMVGHQLVNMHTRKVPAVVTVQAKGNAPLNRAWTKMQIDGKNAHQAAQNRNNYMYPWADPKVGGGSACAHIYLLDICIGQL